MKYVTKPVIIEAFQFGMDKEPEWFVQHDKEGGVRRVAQSGNPIDSTFYRYEVTIHNKPGMPFMLTVVNYGDMVIKGIHGEIYPCKKDIFDVSYEPYNDDSDDDLH